MACAARLHRVLFPQVLVGLEVIHRHVERISPPLVVDLNDEGRVARHPTTRPFMELPDAQPLRICSLELYDLGAVLVNLVDGLVQRNRHLRVLRAERLEFGNDGRVGRSRRRRRRRSRTRLVLSRTKRYA